MCELLIRIEDRGCETSFAGDVVHVAPDGWGWGRKERIPPFRVISVPGVEPGAFADMLEPLRAPGGIISKRAAYFDLGALSEKPTLDELMAAKRTRNSAGVIG